jgi:hypothetical protein
MNPKEPAQARVSLLVQHPDRTAPAAAPFPLFPFLIEEVL